MMTSAAERFFLMQIDGDAAAVVLHGHGVVEVDGDSDVVRVAGQRLVDGVVDDLVDHVVQHGGVIGVADVFEDFKVELGVDIVEKKDCRVVEAGPKKVELRELQQEHEHRRQSHAEDRMPAETHCRYDAAGSTRSTSHAEVSCMRRAPQLGIASTVSSPAGHSGPPRPSRAP